MYVIHLHSICNLQIQINTDTNEYFIIYIFGKSQFPSNGVHVFSTIRYGCISPREGNIKYRPSTPKTINSTTQSHLLSWLRQQNRQLAVLGMEHSSRRQTDR